ncbi:hypothetical protein NDK43_07825 [Neobacillus pocheonensis]|uniref:Phasin domain-containing protein n=1 Tax=Neobacillus pocheonensis TaxID=363869 RepID=A0ABT0W7L6_9BACI|nr:hypothetical protein [Neobacillus pocheonensis]
MAQNNKNQESVRFGDSLFNTWANSLDRVNTAQKELEDLFLQTLEKQKETWGKIADGVTRSEGEQLIAVIRESANLSIQNTFGPEVSKAFEQGNAQFDEVSNRVFQLIETPFKESLNLLNQSQEQFQQTIKNGIDQQQKFREDITVQLKSSQKMLFDIYEANSKVALGFFK